VRFLIRPAPFVFLICLAETLSMTGTMYFPALLPSFQTEWGLTNTAAGWINGVFFAGYAITSPILVGLTDRVDARRIYLPCAFLASLSLLLFGWLAEGIWTAATLRLLAGVGLAGTYMPGLKALSDNVAGPKQSRYIVFYTATYGIGTALSVYLAGSLEPIIGWRWGAEILALGPLGALLIFAATVPPRKPLGHGAGLRFSRNDLKLVLERCPLLGAIRIPLLARGISGIQPEPPARVRLPAFPPERCHADPAHRGSRQHSRQRGRHGMGASKGPDGLHDRVGTAWVCHRLCRRA
jgi:MFS family permease